MLEVKKLAFCYRSSGHVLNGLSLTLGRGEIATLIGRSGSGKSTFFKLVTGLLSPVTGTISIDGKPWEYEKVAYMMQEELLLPWRTILRNLTLVGELGQTGISSCLEENARHLLQMMGLANYSQALPSELSVGMRQRLSLARALLLQRPLLLLDEPFGALDVALREEIYSLLRGIRQKNGTTILLITHDFRDALALSDRILLLDDQKISQEWIITEENRYAPCLYQQIRTAVIASSHCCYECVK